MRNDFQDTFDSTDLLTGAKAIADFLGWPRRRVYYVAEKKYLPIQNIGERLLIARKSELTAALSGEGSETA